VAALPYPGVGVATPTPWGVKMIAPPTPVFSDAWWYMLFPGLALVFTVLAFNFVGDAMQDALNPRKRRS
jgi:peptide/nickel transport system permease protein